MSGNRYGPLYAFANGTGARQGEILGLRWQDVSPQQRTATVRGQLDRSRQLAPVKTERGERAFGLPELAVWALRTQRAQQARERIAAGSRWRDQGFVFTAEDGRPVGWRRLDAVFVRARSGGQRLRSDVPAGSFRT